MLFGSEFCVWSLNFCHAVVFRSSNCSFNLVKELSIGAKLSVEDEQLFTTVTCLNQFCLQLPLPQTSLVYLMVSYLPNTLLQKVGPCTF